MDTKEKRELLNEFASFYFVSDLGITNAIDKFLNQDLEVGKWYKGYKILFCITEIAERSCYGYGFDYANEGWVADKMPWVKEGITLATDKEVEEALIKEAKRRGFKEGSKFSGLYDEDIQTLKSVNFFDVHHGALLVSTDIYKSERGSALFDNGKWAEIVEDDKLERIERIEKELKELKESL